MKTAEEYQDAIELTPEQKKAFTALVRAVNRCKKENIYFYQCLETLGALNGNNVRCVDEGGPCGAPNSLQHMDFPKVRTECSFADDTHYVTLHDE